MIADTWNECVLAQQWMQEHKDMLIADASGGMNEAQNVIDVHRMLVRKADEPTWGMMLAVLDGYKKSKGETPK